MRKIPLFCDTFFFSEHNNLVLKKCAKGYKKLKMNYISGTVAKPLYQELQQ